MSTISASTTSTTAFKITTDTTGTLVFQTGSTPTTAVTIDGSQRAAFVAGTAAAPAITTSGDTDTGIYFPAANTLAFSTNGTEDARFDSAGNFGLGVTPSAWGSSFKALQVTNASAIWSATNGDLQLANNAYYDGANYKFIYGSGSAYAAQYQQKDGKHIWQTAGSGSAGGNISFTQAMTLDASGNLLVGTTSATYSASGRGLVEINGSSTSLMALKTGGSAAGYVYHDGTALSLVNTKASYIQFTTNSIDAARIDSSGRFTTPYQPAFRSNRTSSFTTTANVAYEVVFNSGVFDVGSNYSTSTGRFTAPVTGVYYFTSSLQPTASGNNASILFYVNGAFVTYSSVNWSALPARGDMVNSIVLKLTAGDYVSIWVQTTNNMVYDNNGQFSGYLVG